MRRSGKNYIICFRCKVMIKVRQPLIKVVSRTYWNISRTFYLSEEDKEIPALRKIHHLELKVVFPYSSAIITFSSLIILRISETRIVAFAVVLYMSGNLQLSTFCFSIIYTFTHFCSIQNDFSSNLFCVIQNDIFTLTEFQQCHKI